jgi:hypothetical protein
MQSVLALLERGKVNLSAAWRVLSPKSSLITSGVRTYLNLSEFTYLTQILYLNSRLGTTHPNYKFEQIQKDSNFI